MIPVLGIPFLNRPDLLSRCVKSVDYPVANLVIIDNSDRLVLETVEAMVKRREPDPFENKNVRELHVISHRNAGVAGSWNEIIKLFPASYWMICNNDIQFTPGDLEKMALAVESMGGPSMLYGNHGASWFAITRWGVSLVGLFDENIYPAYLEDCDWSYRAKLAGAYCANVAGVNAVHGDASMTGSCTIHSDPELRKKNGETHGRNFTYYFQKWGGINGQEKFQRPFNNPNLPVDYWKFQPEIRQQQQW